VIDTTNAAAEVTPRQSGPRQPNVEAAPGSAQIGGGRVRAGQFANRATTVSQGTLISGVLETALDSTRPGQVRALVSRDVRGFDGSQVLIPRGSRLFGEYRADLQPGQNRALVQWTRLLRPDGVTIAIGSPAADPLGRAGIRGKVDNHFFERFGSAILQTTLDIGSAVATRQLSGPTVVVVPNGAQAALAPLLAGRRQIQPTLRVGQGARVTVFVARDLDFTGAGTRQE
jgi:type IV secretion system protein VirB10